jgi:Protein of unknown function (DUF3302)
LHFPSATGGKWVSPDRYPVSNWHTLRHPQQGRRRLDSRTGLPKIGRIGFMLRDPFLNYFALDLLIFVVVVLFYGIIAIHDVPYLIAKKRNRPHQDAIHAPPAG